MANSKKIKKVRFDYFQVLCYEIDKEGNKAKEKIYDITEVLEKASNLKPKETMKPYRDEKARMQIVKQDKKTGIWELQLLRLRELSPPGIADNDGEYTVFKLDDGEYIGESTSALYDKENSIFVMQRNNTGFTPTGMQEYFNEIINNSDLLFFKTILSGTDIKKITKDKIFRKITLGISTNEFLQTVDKGSSLYGLMKKCLKFQSNRINIELSMGRSKKDKTLDEVLTYDVIRELYDKKFTKKLEVGYRDNPDTKVEYIDLLDDRRVDEYEFKLNKREPLTHEIVYPQMKKMYEIRKKRGTIF